MAKLATAFVVAGALVACGDSESICEKPIEVVDSSSSSSDIIQSSSFKETDSTSSSSQQALSSTPRNDTLSSSIVAQESSSSAKADQGRHDDSTVVSSSSSLAIPSSSSAIPGSSSESPYLWNDEFDGAVIDTSKWAFEIGTGSSGWGNNEKEYYTGRKENAYVQDGILHIRANKEDYEGSGYTSARMITKGKFTFTYGTVEARIALPVGKGIWPAFWMLGENIDAVSWPACGEIDIIEAVNDENIVYGTNHWSNNGEHAQYGKNTKDYYGTSKELDITEFHTYKLTWDKKLITVYVDDFKYHEISIEDNAGNTDAFHKPFFLLLNVAVGGNWPGFEIDDSQFPNEMLVDYIRISQ